MKGKELTWIVDEKTGCWNVNSHYQYSNGYYALYVSGKREMAHRFVYERHFGTIPDGMLVCHHCDNPRCVNPEHLFLGTDAGNAEDKIKKGRANPPKGEEHNRSAFTNEEIAYIREHAEISNSEMARRMKVGKAAIYKVRSRRTWKHLP